MGEYICEWCGETFDISQRLAAHTRWNHKDKPRIKSREGKKILGLDVGEHKGSREVHRENREIAEEHTDFFSNAGQNLFDELRDSGKQTNKKNIVALFENGNTDSPEHMNCCLKLGGIGKPLRGLILAKHYNIIDPMSIINKDTDVTDVTPFTGQRKKSPLDDIHELIRQESELEEIERQTEFYREGVQHPQQPQQQPKPDNGGKNLIEIPVPSPFNPYQYLRDSEGNIVTVRRNYKQMMMQQQLQQQFSDGLKGDKSETTGLENPLDDTRDAIKKSKQPKENTTQDIENQPEFIALREQMDKATEQMDRILEVNNTLREKELPTVNETKRECVQIESPIESEENIIEDTKMEAIKFLNRTKPLKEKDTQLRIEQQVLE